MSALPLTEASKSQKLDCSPADRKRELGLNRLRSPFSLASELISALRTSAFSLSLLGGGGGGEVLANADSATGT